MRAVVQGLAVIGIAAAGCSTPVPRGAPAEGASLTGAQAEIREPGGRVVARSVATQVGDSVRVRIEATGLAAGSYGAHVHTAGRCDPPSFESAGPHWNPSGRAHGRDNPAGQHMGDLPNLVVGTQGSGSVEFTIPGASISSGGAQMIDMDGAAIVIHARPDDYRTDPSGNSGARIACGVLS